MLFVTVGTHEQQFNRLVQCIDELKRRGNITEDVFIQTGFSTFKPEYCEHAALIPFQEMDRKITEARIVITHGGPSSFIAPLQKGKIPIVVPRRSEYGEHINDHQVEFCNAVAERQGNIIVVNNIERLSEIIANYDDIVSNMSLEMKSNNDNFIRGFEQLVAEIM